MWLKFFKKHNNHTENQITDKNEAKPTKKKKKKHPNPWTDN